MLPADWIQVAGPLGAMIGLAVGGALMVIVGVSYGFLARTFPVAGGTFAYTLAGFGRNHAFISAWFMVLGYVSIVALNASALALLGRRLLPSVVERGYLYTIAGWDVYIGEVVIASAALVIFAVLNLWGAGNSARIQFYMALVMLGAVAILAFGMAIFSHNALGNLRPAFAAEGSPIPGILMVVGIAPWAFIGFDSIPQTAEEFDFPAKKATGLIVWSLVAATVLYVLMIFATAAGAPWQESTATGSVWVVADVISAVLGVVGLALLSVAALMGIATGLNGFYMASSRALLAMGRANMIPRGFSLVNGRSGAPSTAIWFVCLVGLPAPWFGRVALSWIVDMASIGFTFALAYTSLTAYRVFSWTGQPARVPGSASTAKKLSSALGAVIAAVFTVLLLAPGSPAQLTPPSLIALAFWALMGAAFFFSRRKRLALTSDEDLYQHVMGTSRPPWVLRETKNAPRPPANDE